MVIDTYKCLLFSYDNVYIFNADKTCFVGEWDLNDKSNLCNYAHYTILHYWNTIDERRYCLLSVLRNKNIFNKFPLNKW